MAVPGPGAASQRTDKTAQPVRIPTGLPYGSAKQVEGMQQAVAVPQNTTGRPQLGGAPGEGIPPDLAGLLGSAPTARPSEPITAGTGLQPPIPPSGGLDPVWVSALAKLAADPRTSDELRALAIVAIDAAASGGNSFFPEF